jgi:hypothetical protein
MLSTVEIADDGDAPLRYPRLRLPLHLMASSPSWRTDPTHRSRGWQPDARMDAASTKSPAWVG